TLLVREESQTLQIAAGQLANGSECLGSGSEVQCFRVESGQGLLVEPLPPREAPELFDHLGVSAAVGGADAYIYAAGGPFPREMVRACRAGMDLQRQHVGPPPRQDVDLRHQTGGDPVG